MDENRGHIDEITSNIKNKDLLSARRAHLADVATGIFVRRGLDNVSVNEIAAEAGMSVGSLYKYVRTKEDILWIVMDHIYGRLEDVLQAVDGEGKDPVEALRLLMDAYLRSVYSLREGILLMYREWPNLPRDARRDFMARERDLLRVFVDLVERGKERGRFACPDPLIGGLTS